MLVISRYGLDCKPYNTEYEEITWETCSLRSWLNGEFYETAFIPEEKNVILPSSLSDIPEPISADMMPPVNDGEIDMDEYTIRFLNLPGTAVPTVKDSIMVSIVTNLPAKKKKRERSRRSSRSRRSRSGRISIPTISFAR